MLVFSAEVLAVGVLSAGVLSVGVLSVVVLSAGFCPLGGLSLHPIAPIGHLYRGWRESVIVWLK